MSRSRPSVRATNPATKFFEWNGEQGTVRYYDRDKKENVDLGTKFVFMLLDELATVRGWHQASKSGIYANEVRDTRSDVLLVKSFKGGILAEGLYRDIKDRVKTKGGKFVANCYIAWHDKASKEPVIAALQFKGGALGAWMEFRKAAGDDLYEGAVQITGFTEGKTGKITFRTPTFKVVPVTDASKQKALELDSVVQAYLDTYLQARTSERVEAHAEDEDQRVEEEPGYSNHVDDDEDDIPF